ncbi:MAG: hypothetical protein ABL958_04310 [Bdellovibrionia bacterium]
MTIDEALLSYNLIVTQFAKQEFTSSELRAFLAPGVPQMSGGPAPADVAFWFETESTVTIRTADPFLGEMWWPKTGSVEMVNELHIRPAQALIPYDVFHTRLNLGGAVEINQGHPLADLQKVHVIHGLKVIVNQIVYPSSAGGQGLVGEVHLHRIFS